MPLVVALLGLSLIVGLKVKRVSLGVGVTIFVAAMVFSLAYLFLYFRL